MQANQSLHIIQHQPLTKVMRPSLQKLKEQFLGKYPSSDAEKAFATLEGKLVEAGHKDKVTVRLFLDSEGLNPIIEFDEPFEVYSYENWAISSRCGLTHGNITREVVEEMAQEVGAIFIPIGMYEHSGIALYLDGAGTCPWDSSSFGVLYTNQNIWERCMGNIPLTRENVLKYCKATIEVVFNAYINGWVYGLEVIDELGNILDAQHGMFYGHADEEKIRERLPEMDYDRDKYYAVIDTES